MKTGTKISMIALGLTLFFTVLLAYITMLVVFCPDSAEASSSRIAMPADLQRDGDKLQDAVFDPLSLVMTDIDEGKIKRESPEATVAMCEAVHKGFDEAGYSLDATFQYMFKQHNMGFWQTTFRSAGYGNLLGPCLGAFATDQLMKAMLNKGIMTKETQEAFKEYRVWIRSVNN